jgi:small subunit ribosomal protein S8
MSATDPISDMLTSIRNAGAVRKAYAVFPASRIKRAIVQVLEREGYLARVEETRDGNRAALKVYLKYTEDREPLVQSIKRVSKPGCRVYAGNAEIPWVKSGFGSVVLSTSHGVMSGQEARRLGVGGEIICEVW